MIDKIASTELTIEGFRLTLFSDGRVWRHSYDRGGQHHTGWWSKGSPAVNGYLRLGIGRKTFYLHRIIAQAFLGLKPGQFVDHVDGDRSNNSIGNLRVLTKAMNARSYCKRISGSTSQYRGVHWSTGKQRWIAQIKHNYQGRCLGSFKDEAEAAKAYDAAAIELNFNHEALNFPHEKTA